MDEHVFRGRTGGFFVDIGAHDGISFSNSLMFEQERCWRGICIEPIPDRFRQCQANRKSICIQGCVAREPGIRRFTIAGGADMLSSLSEAISEERYARMRSEKVSLSEIEVRCYAFNDVMAMHNVEHIDFCSIDTEGTELEILETIDLSKYRPTCFTIEDNGLVLAIWRRMKKHGYVLVERLGGDLVFVDHSHSLSMPKVGFLKKRVLAQRLMKSLARRLLNVTLAPTLLR
jgi:FkbM family methyltransferase